MKQLLSNKWAWAVAILVLLNIASLSTVWFTTCVRHKKHFGRGPMLHHREHRRFGGGDFLNRELNLSETQEKEFEQLREQHFKEIDSNIANVQKVKVELLQSLGKSENELNALFQKLGSYEADLQKSTFVHFNKMYALCNEEQKKILKEKLLEISDKGRHGFMKGRHRQGKWQHRLPPPEDAEEELPHP